MKRLIAWALMLLVVLTGPSYFAEMVEPTETPDQAEKGELHLLWDIPFGSSMEECIQLAQANAGITLKKVEGKDDQLEADLGNFSIFHIPVMKLIMDFNDCGLTTFALTFGGVYTQDAYLFGEDSHEAVTNDACFTLPVPFSVISSCVMICTAVGPFSLSYIFRYEDLVVKPWGTHA